MENNTLVQHQNIQQRYRVVIERAASTKGVLGYKVEANGDALFAVLEDAEKLKAAAEKLTAGAPETPAA